MRLFVALDLPADTRESLAVVLMRSTLHRDGAVYQELDRERLS